MINTSHWIQTLVSMAPPQGDGGQASPYSGFVMLIIMFAIFYFLLIRPQQKKLKEHQQLLGRLQKGDEVYTTGGIIGRIHALTDDVITLQVADNVRIKVQRGSVQGLVQPAPTETK